MKYANLIIPFAGGLGMFIYGMQIMAGGLENAAGKRMKSLLQVLTTNKFMSVALGALITAVIQSSSATTVIVVGFVNSGIMKLTQAVGVIMGANIGTTMTSWLLSLTGIESGNFFVPRNRIILCFDENSKQDGDILMTQHNFSSTSLTKLSL